MAVLGRVIETQPLSSQERGRFAIAVICTAALHLLLFQALMFSGAEPLEPIEDVISVSLITLPPVPQTQEPLPKPTEDPPKLKDAPLPPPPEIKPVPKLAAPFRPLIATPTPDILASSRPVTETDSSNTVPLSQSGATSVAAPTEPSLDEKRIDEGLKSLAAELTCLNRFSADCAEIRKNVFEEFQMTETDKIYTKKYAHTGMPVEFYGMSERQIRAKLNVPNAGENGIVIIPGLLALDGDLWDAMHGVNKKCEWKVAAPTTGDAFAQSGEGLGGTRLGAIKDCPDYLPAAKEDRDRRNKYQVRLEANEARRKAEKDKK